jgi:hypothetical protein
MLAACSDTTPESSRLPATGDKDASRSNEDSSDPITPPDDSGSMPETFSPGGPGRVYAHTPDTLYLYEPISNTLKVVGKFSCLDSSDTRDVVTDIAVDRTGVMFATTFDRVLTVDPVTAKCNRLSFPILTDSIGALDPPNGLSFVPAGTVDPTKEALVGFSSHYQKADATTYVRIDTTTGEMSIIGDMNTGAMGNLYRSSGDMISLINMGNKAYATVKLMVEGGPDGTDLVAEVDPKDGHLIKVIGDTKQDNLFGFGYWAGKGYGFNDIGRIVQIDMTNGSSVVVKTLTDDAGTAMPWYGAGVTTQAPIQ